ncbi:thiol peroxidase [Corynebacterium sp. TAE3-ERU12]|uniref:thiol peroxidase n=1 Tax=Corynebacterium sp. TAE3-ERU12 TaxID=2849491 RepID=UPI001C43AD53|nr:thiol peroxidase [Corynebacterium sp. TAE3-ERU12]MBV7295498.1 thiol peroxidase [Corynebacterium sp. TAE3-ERU12]
MTDTTAFQGTPVTLSGTLPTAGESLPSFTVTGTDLKALSNKELTGKKLVLNIFPSVDTGVCAASVRRFNEIAAERGDATVVNISRDLPFALGRFCAAEGIDGVISASDFRREFGEAFGVVQTDGPLAQLLGRAVVVADANGGVIYSQVVPEITEEPDYDAALAALDS